MVLNNTVRARTFIYCSAFFGPNESVEYFSGGDGYYHQYIYIIHGSGVVEYRTHSTGDIIHREDSNLAGQLLDVSCYQNMYKTTITTNDPIASIQFNPLPTTRQLNIKILKEGMHVIDVCNEELSVVCIAGKPTIGDKVLYALQHARVSKNSSIVLKLGIHDICAIVSS